MGAISTTLYDAAGRVKATVDPLAYRRTVVYDAAGRMVGLRDPNGNRTTTVYDAAGRPVATVNALSNRVTTVFDAAGRRVALVDPNGHRTTFQYNADGTQRAQIDPLSRRTSYGYDAAMQRTWKLDPRGIRTTYAFDLDGRLVARKPSGEAPATFAYDAVGNRTLMRDSTGRTTSIYDVVNRLCSARDPAGKVITLGYDAAGGRSSMIDPDNGRTTYGYDAAGRIDHLLNPYNERTTRSYDAAGRVTVERLGNGSRASYLYDAAGQLTHVVHQKSTGAVLSEFNYAYDPAGNRARVAASGQSLTYRTSWSYDETNQLRAEYCTGDYAALVTYVYDAAGNRLSRRFNPNPPNTYTYDAANQLQVGKSALWNDITTYVYDAAGNLLAERSPGVESVATYIWDAENRLTGGRTPSGPTGTMVYRADGLRVRKEEYSGTKKFVWDDQRLLLETDSNDATQAAYTSLPENFGQLVSQRRGGASQFYHLDALGSVVGLTNSSQTETDCYGYSAFGTDFAELSSSTNPFRYVGALGYYYDGWDRYYVRARHYDPFLGRWLLQDPIGPWMDDPNLYRYVGNHPLNATDPTGEDWSPRDCPERCLEQYGNAAIDQGVLDRLEKKLKAHAPNVAKVYYRKDCGGTAFSLYCKCQIGEHKPPKGSKARPRPIYKSLVCINTKTFSNTCSAIEALEHEFVHVHGGGEKRAYKKSCEIQAQQECWKCFMKQNDIQKKIDECTDREMKHSTGKENEAEIKRGCDNLCAEYLAGLNEK